MAAQAAVGLMFFNKKAIEFRAAGLAPKKKKAGSAVQQGGKAAGALVPGGSKAGAGRGGAEAGPSSTGAGAGPSSGGKKGKAGAAKGTTAKWSKGTELLRKRKGGGGGEGEEDEGGVELQREMQRESNYVAEVGGMRV